MSQAMERSADYTVPGEQIEDPLFSADMNLRCARFIGRLLGDKAVDVSFITQAQAEGFVDQITAVHSRLPVRGRAWAPTLYEELKASVRGTSDAMIAAEQGGNKADCAIWQRRHKFIGALHRALGPEAIEQALADYLAEGTVRLATNRLVYQPPRPRRQSKPVVTPKAASQPSEVQSGIMLQDEQDEGRYLNLDLEGRYIEEASRSPLLEASEEVELAKQIEAGVFAWEKLETEAVTDETYRRELTEIVRIGTVAKERFISANLRLVINLAKRYRPLVSHMKYLDLIQEGNLGLIRAVEKFDYQKGYKFSTYATWWIRQAIGRSMGNTDRAIRLPVHKADTLRKVRATGRRLSMELGRDATQEELAAELGLELPRLSELLREGSYEPLSLDEVITTRLGDQDGGDFKDVIPDKTQPTPEEAVVENEMNDLLHAAIKKLSARETQVIQLRFGFGGRRIHTYEEIASILGVTRATVCYTEKKATAKLDRLLADDYYAGQGIAS